MRRAVRNRAIESMRAEVIASATGQGRRVTLATHFVPHAMAALAAGDAARHDALIADSLSGWDAWKDTDALVLAQFSMARSRPVIAQRCALPVLISSDSAVLALKRALGQ